MGPAPLIPWQDQSSHWKCWGRACNAAANNNVNIGTHGGTKIRRENNIKQRPERIFEAEIKPPRGWWKVQELSLLRGCVGIFHSFVFCSNAKKFPFIHLHMDVPQYSWDSSIGVGGKTKFANKQMVKLGRNPSALTSWREWHFCKWPIDPHEIHMPKMLVLPPDCVVSCETTRRTVELYGYVMGLLKGLEQDPWDYHLIMDWCWIVAHAGTGKHIN